jgi:hypothetical protein
MNSKYLVRKDDSCIFEIDPSNDCYRPLDGATYSDGTVPKANKYYNFEYLVDNFEFFPISEKELDIYKAKNKLYLLYTNWASRSDGHGGTKGGTMEEYLNTRR